jgi:hypothetical protein
MIAGVKAWLLVLSALLTLLPCPAQAAEDSGSAARELARKTVLLAGRGEPVSVAWRNLSSLPSGEFSQVRSVFEAAVRDAGGRISEIAPVAEARLTVSENLTELLLVEEVRKGEERQVWLVAWKRMSGATAAHSAIVLEKKLVWEQAEQILDAIVSADSVLVLSPSGVKLQAHGGAQTAQLAVAKPWPRDLRGRLTSQVTSLGARFKAYLPGVVCAGEIEPVLTLECHAGEEGWPLELAASAPAATFKTGRNYFEGHISMAQGAGKILAPFFSAAKVLEAGRTFWAVAMVDGRTQILDGNFEPVGSVAQWGSDVAATEAPCGGGSQLLATKAGDPREPDTLRAFGIVNRAPVALSAPLDLPGPVTALWSAGGSGAVAVVHDAATGHYLAFLVTVNCGG